MKFFAKYIVLFFLLTPFYSCKKENLCDCFKGTGKDVTELRTLLSFNKVLIQDKIDVHILKGSGYSVRITAGSKVISLIKTKVENNQLTITDENTCDFTRSYKRKIVVYITLPDIIKLQHDGLGEVVMEDEFMCDTLSYYLSNSGNLHLNVNATTVYGGMHGNGDVTIKGKIKSNFINAGGQGFYNSQDAISSEMILTLATSGKMEVNAIDFLKVDMLVNSSGDVYYNGNPSKITAVLKGKGKLIKQ